jgi:hypothetical protein
VLVPTLRPDEAGMIGRMMVAARATARRRIRGRFRASFESLRTAGRVIFGEGTARAAQAVMAWAARQGPW